jgi:predicted esterase
MKRASAPVIALAGFIGGLALFAAAGPSLPAGQAGSDRPPVRLAEVPKELAPVDFVAVAPTIDGRLDRGLEGLPRRAFSQVDPFGPAPRGRGPSNAFSRDHAQEDIAEAIAAVAASYPVDETRIVLTGFSMGGYGAYRTYFERPGRFRALAAFSGHPDLANSYFPGEAHPNFLEDKTLGRFKGLPVFVFHGAEDRNCPYETTRELVAKLRKAGAKVEFVTEPGAGHQRPGAEALRRYQAWLESVLR